MASSASQIVFTIKTHPSTSITIKGNVTLPRREPYKLIGGQLVYGVHSPKTCTGDYCTIHNHSGHHMRKWHQHFTGGEMYRVCAHGVLHDDPDDDGYEMLECSCHTFYDARCTTCCIDPRELKIIDLSHIVQAMG